MRHRCSSSAEEMDINSKENNNLYPNPSHKYSHTQIHILQYIDILQYPIYIYTIYRLHIHTIHPPYLPVYSVLYHTTQPIPYIHIHIY